MEGTAKSKKPSTVKDSKKPWICPVCFRVAGAGTFVCMGCLNWVHPKCGGYAKNYMQDKNIDVNELKCNNCKEEKPANSANSGSGTAVIDSGIEAQKFANSVKERRQKSVEDVEENPNSDVEHEKCFGSDAAVIDCVIERKSDEDVEEKPNSVVEEQKRIDFTINQGKKTDTDKRWTTQNKKHCAVGSDAAVIDSGIAVVDSGIEEEKFHCDKDADVDNFANLFSESEEDEEFLGFPPPEVEEGTDINQVTAEDNNRYYLKINRKNVFIGCLIPHEEGDLVHNRGIPAGYGKFLLKTVFLNRALAWNEYNPDYHCVGAYVVWCIEDVSKCKCRDLIPVTLAGEAKDMSGPKEVPLGKGRKRMRNDTMTKAAIRKRKRDKGESYSPKKGKGRAAKPRKEARVMQPVCPVTCRNKCREKLTEQDREQIFTTYWEIGNVEAQWEYINRQMMANKKKRTRLRRNDDNDDDTAAPSRRSNSKTYQLNGKVICKTMFLNTLAISEKVTRTAMAKCKKGFTEKDQRGTTKNRKYGDDDINKVKDFIKRFPVMEAHYVRERCKRQFLSSDLNITILYNLYLKTDKSSRKVGEQTFRNIFNTSFNLGFHKPKKDKCSVCIQFQNAIPSQVAKLKLDYEIHQANKGVAREIKTNAKVAAAADPQKLGVFAFDLQKVLNVPHGDNGLFYYSRRLSVYNLTVTDLVTKDGFCYTWDQTVAQRGANEISSCVGTHLQEQLSSTIEKATLFCDNCPGQNKNRFMLQMMALTVIKTLNLHEIELIFLEKGHTQNANDTIHSVIENAKKGIEVLHPVQWLSVLQMACKASPYTVRMMEQEDMLDYKTSLGSMFVPLVKNKVKNLDGKKVKIYWSNLRHVLFKKPDDDKRVVMLYKYDLTVPFQAAVIGVIGGTSTTTRRSASRRSAIEPLITPVQAYTAPLYVSMALKKDLMKLCSEKTNAIPHLFRQFYENLRTIDSFQEDDDDIDPNRESESETDDDDE